MDTRTKTDLQRLVKTRRELEALEDARKPSPLLQSTAIGRPVGGAGTAGISSPLTEGDAATRTYYPAGSLLSSDGLFSIVYERIHEINMTDAKEWLAKWNYYRLTGKKADK